MLRHARRCGRAPPAMRSAGKPSAAPSATRWTAHRAAWVDATSSREAARVPGVVGAVAGAPVVGVVGRRAERQELESRRCSDARRADWRTAPRRPPRCRRRRRRTRPGCRARRRAGRPASGCAAPCRAASASSKSTIHFMPASIASCSLRARWSARLCGSGPTASGRTMSRPVTASTAWPPDCTTAIQRSGSSRASGACRQAASWPSSTTATAGNCGATASVARRHAASGAAAGLVGCSARAIQAARAAPKRVGQLSPGSRIARRIVAGEPVLLPVVRAPLALVGRQLGLVRIEVDLVGIDAHAQLGAAVGQREEARLEPYRQQRERQVAGAQRVCSSGGNCAAGVGLRQVRRLLNSAGASRMCSRLDEPCARNCEAWIAMRTGSWRVMPAMCAALQAPLQRR